MAKKLSEMTIEELWQLFPIFLVPPKSEWKIWYAEQQAALKNILPNTVFNHIGSTAINGIWAKNIVDILAETDADMDYAHEILVNNGWICMNRKGDRASYNLGYTENGFAEKVFHLHLRRPGDRDEVYFRDYMNSHPEAAKEYETLKLSLWKQYEHDRDGYTNAKNAIVHKYTRMARIRFEYMPNEAFSTYAPELFNILYENNQSVAQSHDAWYNAVSDGMKKSARRIILIKDINKIIGFFQYYANSDTFMMEEIQLKSEYRTKYGIFRSLYAFLVPKLSENIKYIRAYAEISNEKSDGILRRMGLSEIEENVPHGICAYLGNYADFIRWYEKSRS